MRNLGRKKRGEQEEAGYPKLNEAEGDLHDGSLLSQLSQPPLDDLVKEVEPPDPVTCSARKRESPNHQA